MDDAVHKEKLKGKATIESQVEECNRIDEALKDGGPVKAAIAAGSKQLPINKKLLDVWDMNGLEWWPGHLLLIMQVILGYVLLGALVTRFAFLFTASRPLGNFA